MRKSELKDIIKECIIEGGLLSEVSVFPNLVSKWKGKGVYHLFQITQYQYDLVELKSGIMTSMNIPALKTGKNSLKDIEDYLEYNGYKRVGK